jgi:hypothetical protein
VVSKTRFLGTCTGVRRRKSRYDRAATMYSHRSSLPGCSEVYQKCWAKVLTGEGKCHRGKHTSNQMRNGNGERNEMWTEHSTADLQETGDQDMIRPCPECGAGVESDTVKVNALKTYTYSQCGAKLWLIQSALSDRLVVAQVTQ